MNISCVQRATYEIISQVRLTISDVLFVCVAVCYIYSWYMMRVLYRALCVCVCVRHTLHPFSLADRIN